MKTCLGEGFLFSKYSLEARMEEISKIGYGHVETGVNAHAPQAEIEEIASVMQRYGIKPAAIGGGGPIASLNEETRRQAVENVERQIIVARMLGCDMVTCEMSGGTSDQRDECIQAFKVSSEELVPVLEKERVQAAFEAHPGDFVEDNNTAVDILKEIGHDNIGYLYCGPHTFILGEDPAAMIEYAADVLKWVHIADTYKQERIIVSDASKGYVSMVGLPDYKGLTAHMHLVPGDGEVDFGSIFRTLKRIGYDGFVSAIPFDSITPVETAAQSLKMMQKYIDEA